jgi:hypothetical protein
MQLSEAKNQIDIYNLLKSYLQKELAKHFTIMIYDSVYLPGRRDFLFYPIEKKIAPMLLLEQVESLDVYFLYVAAIKQTGKENVKSEIVDKYKNVYHKHINDVWLDIVAFYNSFMYSQYEELYDKWLEEFANNLKTDLLKYSTVFEILENNLQGRDKIIALRNSKNCFFEIAQTEHVEQWWEEFLKQNK